MVELHVRLKYSHILSPSMLSVTSAAAAAHAQVGGPGSIYDFPYSVRSPRRDELLFAFGTVYLRQ